MDFDYWGERESEELIELEDSTSHSSSSPLRYVKVSRSVNMNNFILIAFLPYFFFV